MKIGNRVKVVDQDIFGTIIRYDCGDKVVILDENPDQDLEDDDEPSLTFRKSELTIIG